MQLVSDDSITQEADGMVLTILTPIFGQAVFKNFELNILDFDLNQIDMYPNPSNSIVI